MVRPHRWQVGRSSPGVVSRSRMVCRVIAGNPVLLDRGVAGVGAGTGACSLRGAVADAAWLRMAAAAWSRFIGGAAGRSYPVAVAVVRRGVLRASGVRRRGMDVSPGALTGSL